MSGKDLNPGRANSKSKLNKFATHQVSRTIKFDRDSTPIKNMSRSPVQVSTAKVSDNGGSVAGFPRQSDTLVQIELKNRFQVFQDTLDHEHLGDQ